MTSPFKAASRFIGSLGRGPVVMTDINADFEGVRRTGDPRLDLALAERR